MTEYHKLPNGLYCLAGGVMTYAGSDYAWFGDGNYEVYTCTCADREHRVELAD